MHKTLLRVVLVAALFTPLSVLLPTIASAAVGGPACFVPADYATIQAAANDAGCTSINVAAGTYTENVSITNPATIISTSSAILAGEFDVNASSTITGFTINHPAGTFGVLINHVGNVTVIGNTISDIGTTVTTDHTYGVWFQSSGSVPVSGITIGNNIISNIGNTSNPFTSADIGIGDSASTQNITSGLMITNNALSNVFTSTKGAYGILINLGSAANTAAVTGAVISGNSISGLTSTSGWVHAIGIEGNAPSININHNTISGLTGGAPALAIWFEHEDPSFSSALVNRNSLDVGGASYGIAVDAMTGSPLDGTCNWWGSASGPGPVGPGTGSLVTASTTFQQWLTTSDITNGPCNGPLPTTATLTIVKHTSGRDGAFNFAIFNGSATTTVATTTVNGAATTAPQTLAPGGYDVSEVLPAGWTFNGVSCVYDNASIGQVIANGEHINVEAGDSVTCTFSNTKNVIAAAPQVHIFKYVDNVPATAANTNSTTFPMNASWVSSTLGTVPSAPFTLSPTGWAAGDAPYEASYVGGAAGDNYATNEVLTSAVVGATCDGSHTYALGGYSTGDTLAHAFANASSTASPSFTNLQADEYVIVWNKLCTTVVPPTGTGSISGSKFEDWDGDGSPFETKWEEGLSGWTITITGPNNFSSSTVTGKNGKYIFPNLPAGTYTISEVQKSGWVSTYPSSNPALDKWVVTLADGQAVKKKDFGNFMLGSISGMKFNDANGNHKKDANEAGLQGWVITIKGPNGYAATTTTDANGNYSFTGLFAGKYKLAEVMQTGWKQTVHPGTVEIDSGSSPNKKNFGNKLKVTGDPKKDKDDGQNVECDD